MVERWRSKRKNPADTLHYGKEVSLFIFSPSEIAAGRSRYQIAEQPVFRKDKIPQDRRGDVMLLINGMPLIHIELEAIASRRKRRSIRSKNICTSGFSPGFCTAIRN